MLNLPERIKKHSNDLTAVERKLASALLADYPFSGLKSIQALSENTHISAPSITRFVHKLGYKGYQAFQRNLISELKEEQLSPVELHQRSNSVSEGFLDKFLNQIKTTLSQVAMNVTNAQFERICKLLADQKKSLYLVGGRISDPLAQLLSRHLQQTRQGVYHLPRDPEMWPEYIMRMNTRDVLVMVDFRRYEQRMLRLASKISNKRGVHIILITDKWLSPIAKYASEILALPIESNTPWDTYCGALALIEAMITYVSDQNWDQSQKRIKRWDENRVSQSLTETKL